MEVDGATFSASKRIIHEPTKTETTLVAKGKSYLSYFYVGVCSSVLYLPPAASNDVVLFQDGCDYADNPIALEICYHKPARAADLQWATIKFLEGNLPNEKNKITDLSLNMQEKLSQFNNLYRNVQIGDRYTLEYIPSIGVRLLFNDELLDTIGMDMPMHERHELAKLIYSVWFGEQTPFSESMKNELLAPIDPPVTNIPSVLVESAQRIKVNKRTISKRGEVKMKNDNILATAARGDSSEEETMTEEERKLLESLGLLEILKDDSTSSSPIQTSSERDSQTTNVQINQSESSSGASTSSPDTIQQLPAWARIRNFIYPAKNVPLQPEASTMDKREVAFGSKAPYNSTHSAASTISADESKEDDEDQSKYNSVLLGLGGAAFLLPHLAVLLSLPPVLRGRGAPYLPTFGNKQSVMFDLLRNHVFNSKYMKHKQAQKSLQFVDLGSGDGRVVFRAAREGMFAKSVGYEINIALHIFASARRMLTPQYWNSTQFYMRDLWKIQLQNYDVVAVYGLAPIMQRLGKKLEAELRPGSVVVSNVFEIPGWRVSDASSGMGKGVYLYHVPECFRGKKKTATQSVDVSK